MIRQFVTEFKNFLETHNIDYSESNSLFVINGCSKKIALVTLAGTSKRDKEASITIYEDEWYTKYKLITGRLLANLGRQKTIYARKCVVKKISNDEARVFLEKNHLLGYVKCRYNYGLFLLTAKHSSSGEELVAVSCFSASRPIERDGQIIDSYEWVRYASVVGFRVVGGMGRLMNLFVEEQSPQEIMSYSDKDWGDGAVYKQLGFEFHSETEPIEFVINTDTYERVSIKKLRSDRKYRAPEQLGSEWISLRNQGNLKFLWRPSLNN